MSLARTAYFFERIEVLHDRLLNSEVVNQWLTAAEISMDGKILNSSDTIKLPFFSLSILEFSHLFAVFNGSRVHAQKLGFNAPIDKAETRDYAHLVTCNSVQDVLHTDAAWWDAKGFQRLMEFDLTATSRSWEKLLSYVEQKMNKLDKNQARGHYGQSSN